MERADTDRTEKEKQNWKSGKLDYMLLGQQIKKYRVQKKLRQKDLAALVYTTTNTCRSREYRMQSGTPVIDCGGFGSQPRCASFRKFQSSVQPILSLLLGDERRYF